MSEDRWLAGDCDEQDSAAGLGVADAPLAAPRFLDAGECALVIELGNSIDAEINERVLALDTAITAEEIAGVEEVIPTYKSILLHYDPLVVSRQQLVERIGRLKFSATKRPRRLWQFPACYDPVFALDLGEVAWSLSLPEDAIAELHRSVRYRIYMHGFAPGLPALGELPEELRLPRRLAPRQLVPEGSLLIAARQASIAAVNMPSGWHVIGRTPERLFVPERDPVILTRTGDEIIFEPVDVHTYEALSERALAGEIVAKVTDGIEFRR